MSDHPITNEEAERIAETMGARFAADLEVDERFEVSGDLGDEIVTAKFVLSNHDRSNVVELEARVSLDDNDIAMPDEGFDLAIDLLDEMFQAYFAEGRDVRFHLNWKVYEVRGKSIELRGTRRNVAAERAADEFLKNHSH